jgi:nephrocystin-4
MEETLALPYKRSRKERQDDLATIQVYREKNKNQTIMQRLTDEITTRFQIHTSYGQAHYFEFILQNPYGNDENFELNWAQDDLR